MEILRAVLSWPTFGILALILIVVGLCKPPELLRQLISRLRRVKLSQIEAELEGQEGKSIDEGQVAPGPEPTGPESPGKSCRLRSPSRQPQTYERRHCEHLRKGDLKSLRA